MLSKKTFVFIFLALLALQGTAAVRSDESAPVRATSDSSPLLGVSIITVLGVAALIKSYIGALR